MAIKFIEYTKEQRKSTRVTGYSLYVNSSHRCICDSVHQIMNEVKHYSHWNDIEIYQILSRS